MPITTVQSIKGAFIDVGAGLLGALPNIVVFQFNPETIVRTSSISLPPSSPAGAGKQISLQQPDGPTESISFTLRIDATDQLVGLGAGTSAAATSGILPTLSALESLMIPKPSFAANLNAPGRSPSYRSPPITLPTVLFFWGKWRILPVTISSLNITETEFDVMLNPVRAEVSISLHVLLPSQIASGDMLALHAYQYTQKTKEALAALNAANAVDIGVSNVLSFSL